MWIATSVAWRFAIHGIWWTKQDNIENHMIDEVIVQSVLWSIGLIAALIFVALSSKSPNWSCRFEWIATNIFFVALGHMVLCEYLYDNLVSLP